MGQLFPDEKQLPIELKTQVKKDGEKAQETTEELKFRAEKIVQQSISAITSCRYNELPSQVFAYTVLGFFFVFLFFFSQCFQD